MYLSIEVDRECIRWAHYFPQLFFKTKLVVSLVLVCIEFLIL